MDQWNGGHVADAPVEERICSLSERVMNKYQHEAGARGIVDVNATRLIANLTRPHRDMGLDEV